MKAPVIDVTATTCRAYQYCKDNVRKKTTPIYVKK